MKPVLKAFVLLVLMLVVLAAAGIWYVVNAGVGAREQPGRIEAFLARRVRDMAIASRAESLTNPVGYSAAVVAEGRAHFADHCAICHANDGSGDTTIGQGMWPRAPDMRLDRTQNLSDGELFWIIENGIRFTGMPAWSTGTEEGELESWHLVHFIRHLPKLTAEELEEMKSLNPRPPAEIREGSDEKKSPAHADPHKHSGGHDE